MKKFLALAIFALVSQPAHAGIFDLMIYGPPDRYGQAFAQCAASTVTAAQGICRPERNVAGRLTFKCVQVPRGRPGYGDH
jgi:hypothetical protein